MNDFAHRLIGRIRARLRAGAARFIPALRPRPQLQMWRSLEGEIPAFELPAPYRFVRYEAGAEEEWARLLDQSGEFGRWDAERVRKEMATKLIPGAVCLIGDGTRVVACAAACALPAALPDSTLMYVVTLPEHRGRKLGSIVTAEVMRVAKAAGFPGMILWTDDTRLAAVKTYLALGFTQRYGEGAAGARRWDAVLSRIGARS